ncbi:hypothetical protein BAUCODRAFT_118684 [Baudoinia panamericana UAMH 10762]|uniref:Zn(2)-C6 fungal-type domain-containing protein n=1 Tax=Baudoinia panamericana (strain UAMH 10762) TaxID=717646 RepID=M2M1M8_BAUPA|nr:uncharacterized protein BAUCODRAFT_118684 [Baudoinia panamericana UAMH 10762]EMD00958.1 hypothetical protein BAUCODRAFT_118684 [Baudoinia panamericana UAMH 10762]
MITAPDGRGVKRRAACDECRSKKLKCTGTRPSCSRCAREGIPCVYSPQSQMGRPKKRARLDANEERDVDAVGSNNWPSVQRALAVDVDVDVDLDGDDWLQSTDWTVPSEYAIPGLTPDAVTNSPPVLNLPPELLATTHGHSPNYFASPHVDASTNLLLDPSFSGPTRFDPANAPTNVPSCACLSNLYLTLSTLSTLQPPLTFPFALHPLRAALQTASEVIDCDKCPKRFLTAVQNTQLLGTLLLSIAERYGKVLDSITAEAIRAETAGEGKRFRLADLNTPTSHLHAGGLGCAAAFSIGLSPAEWRGMGKKVVRAEVYGPGECCPHLVGVIERMERRQMRYHESDECLPEDFPRDAETGVKLGGKCIAKEDHVCLKLCVFARRLVEGFDWS